MTDPTPPPSAENDSNDVTPQPPRSRGRSRRIAIAAIAVAVVAAVAVVGSIALTNVPHPSAPVSTHSVAKAEPTISATPSSPPYTAPSAAEIAALPEAKYNAVIPGLMASTESTIPAAATASYSISADAPLYGADRKAPVARLAAKNFLADNTIVVPVTFSGDWALVLTPSRQQLPSQQGGNAAAQSAGWLRRDLLTKVGGLPTHVVVALGAQTVSIVNADDSVVRSFAAGVGASSTPTPTGVVGYIQARYLDPAQGQSKYPINLTSLHASASDEPYSGHDGGLIGVHYEAAATGNISHGCVRLNASAVTAINALPLGTLVVISK